MATISRVVKGNGTQAWEDGDNFPASEINGDLDAVLNGVNGNLDNGNLTALANIAVTKVGDNSADDATQNLTVSPGDSLSTSLPSDLKGEIERLRHRIKMNTAGTKLQARNAAGAMVDLGWAEPATVGPNLLPNSGFELQSDGAGTAPDGWTLSGVPATIVVQAASNDAAGTEKTSINIIGNSVGITYTLTGLKSNTKYRIGAEYERTLNTFSITTSGGLGSSTDYGDINYSDAALSGIQYFNGVLKTDGSGTDLVVSLLVSGGASSEVNIFRVWAQEMSDLIPVIPSLPNVVPTQIVTDSASATYTSSVASLDLADLVDHTPLDISVTVPSYGYELDCQMIVGGTMTEMGATLNAAAFVLKMDIDGGGYSEVHRIHNQVVGTGDAPVNVSLRHVIPNPVVGSTYSFRLCLNSQRVSDVIKLNTVDDSNNSQSKSILTLRRY